MNYGIFQIGWWEKTLFPAQCGSQALILSDFFFFSGALLFPHMHALIRPLRIPESSLSETLFSLAVCPTNSSYLGSPRLSVLSPQIRELHWVPCAFFQPEPVWNTLNARYSPGNHRAHLICFLSFRDCCPSVPDAQCLKNYYFIHFVSF